MSISICAIHVNGEEKAAWTANPSTIYQQKGSYPSSVTVRLFWNSCQYDNNGQIKPGQLSGTFTVSVTCVAIKASPPIVGDCSLTTTLDVSAAQPGLQALTVQKDGKDDGFASISFMYVAARPTPDKPEVDVFWEVLTDHLCSDNFGNHIKGDLYCIDVKIGNNSGYALQLAGLGFMRKSLSCKFPDGRVVSCVGESGEISTPNVGYQTTRASAQNSSLLTGRNLFVNGMQAIGLLMTSFAPYFENSSIRADGQPEQRSSEQLFHKRPIWSARI